MAAVPSQTQNFISRLQALAEVLLEAQNEAKRLAAEWSQNGIEATLVANDLLDNATFNHLTPTEITNGVTAIGTFDTALGDYSSGQAVNLLKLRQ